MCLAAVLRLDNIESLPSALFVKVCSKIDCNKCSLIVNWRYSAAKTFYVDNEVDYRAGAAVRERYYLFVDRYVIDLSR